MKKAVITGATGSVGRAIIDKLIAENVEITVLCHRGSKRVDDIPDNRLIKKVCCSLDEMKSFVPEENDYDVFYHLAWAGTTGTARDDADLQLKNIGRNGRNLNGDSSCEKTSAEWRGRFI